MEKGKGLMVDGRRWAVDFSDNSSSNSTRDIPDPPGFTRASQDQDDSTLSRQKKDAESNWKAQVLLEIHYFGRLGFLLRFFVLNFSRISLGCSSREI